MSSPWQWESHGLRIVVVTMTDSRSLLTSGCFVHFTHLIFIGIGVRDVLRSWLDPKRTNPDTGQGCK